MSRIPDLLVEKVHLDEATDAERALVEGDAEARERLAALSDLDAAFLEALPPDEEIRRIEGRARTQQARAQQGIGRIGLTSAVIGPLLAFALALLWINLPPAGPDAGGGLEETTAKGLDPKLHMYRKRSDRVERIAPGIVARQGDLIQIGMVKGSATHGVVISVDGRGSVTTHFPSDRLGDTTLANGERVLQRAYELDDAPEYERFFFVTTATRPDLGAIVAAAEALPGPPQGRTAPLALPDGYDQYSFVVRKERR